MTTVRDELDHVRQYLLIQKERYQEKLGFEITAKESVLDISIPKIILQPLVENAIYHGIRKLPGLGFIKIMAFETGEYIFLTIEDNGVGMDTSVPVERDENSRLGGVGIQNVEERIHLYYGDNSGVVIQSKLGEGTKVTIKLYKGILS